MQRSNNCPLRLIMHPFCCVSTVNNDRSSSALPDLPPPPSMPSEISTASSSGRRSDSNDVGRRSQRTVVPASAAAESGPPRPAPAPQLLLSGDQREVKINDLVGSGISGVLYKWVNYGKGWRPRWFVLQDGVLSYYKIHGPDKIVVSLETEKGSRVIGEDSLRRISRRKTGGTQLRRNPIGEVSSIRESRSDDKRFSIFTGTKRLHLRAETRDDRMAWMDALQAVKDMFPRLSNSELMAPVDNVVVSTEKLRQRLLEEGLSESAIQDSEQIVRSEFAVLQSQLMVLKQKHWVLLDTLRQLEQQNFYYKERKATIDTRSAQKAGFHGGVVKVLPSNTIDRSVNVDVMVGNLQTEKVDLENTVVDESQRQLKELEPSSGLRQDKSSELYSFESEDDVDPSIKSVGKNFPHVKRRKRLPEPVEKEKGGNSLMRILNVAAFAVSGYASTEGRHCKPFNPLLGETYEAEYPDKGLQFFSEKVSHHPMIVACHCEGTGWKFWGDSNLKSKFWGRSIQLDPVGVLTLEFDDGEVFQWSKVTTSIYNLILGKLYCDHYGTMRVEGNHNYSCKLKFKEQSIIDRNPHQVQGLVQDKNGKTVATLFGKWDESLYYMNGESSGKGKGTEGSEAHLLWKRSKPPKFPTRYNLTRFAITLNELTSQLKEKLPPTDSRLRPDQRCLENGEYDMANSEKLRLEQRQRQARKMQESGWKPKWFAKEKGSDTYRYIGGYWEAREKRSWDSCPDIFGHFPSDQVSE
ncbi:hypothetical protein RHMOL_Rhmol11G0122900 [Rhododendron molle]|uniref:Uncharacterized protein n=1 Tax=Rhododendron molle TaxID=49168 RepID=A0ACC0LSJ7_RHOML|nr:hypothetical protein RHMOL_Rhmol11G0122900 [Rhododendron molle]